MRGSSLRVRTTWLAVILAAAAVVPALSPGGARLAGGSWSAAGAAPPPAHPAGQSSVSGAPQTPGGQGPVAEIRLLVRTGDRAPDGGTFTVLSDPALNDRGDVAFGAETTAQEAAQALYLQRDGRITTLVAVGRRTATGGVFYTFSDVVLNNRGTVIFLGRTTDRTARFGIYATRNGAVVPVVATGQPAPSGGVFTDFANPTINDHDEIAFVGRTNGTGVEGIYTIVEGTTTVAVMGGWPAPTGGLFRFFVDGSPALNNGGQIAFIAATTEHSTEGIYVLDGGRIVPVATTDDTAPGGGLFTEFGFVNLTDAGTVQFVGRTGHSAVREALYATGRAALVTLARQGEMAEDGVPFTTFQNVAINNAEDVVFEPGIVRFPDVYPHAIYLARRSGVTLLTRAGDRAPGGGRFTAYSEPIINDSGAVVFVAETDDGRHGIYRVTLR